MQIFLKQEGIYLKVKKLLLNDYFCITRVTELKLKHNGIKALGDLAINMVV